MAVRTKLLFILIGDDMTGKTSFQKYLIQKLCINHYYEKLETNRRFDITHPEIKRKYRNISFGNRSFQEKIGEYKTVENYFNSFFRDADIAIISSHLVKGHVEEMIAHGKGLFFNVNGIFWTNSIDKDKFKNSEISQLNWDERLIIENVHLENREGTK